MYYIYKFFYHFFWFLPKLTYLVFLGFKVEGRENLKGLKGPLIIVSNHTSWMDSFLIGSSFPMMSRLFPIRFATWHKFYYNPYLWLFVVMFGGFPVRKGIGLKEGLKIPVKILKNNGVVGIFPEGKRRKAGRPRKGRKGAAYLSYKTGANFLPVKIEGSSNMKPIKFLLGYYRVKVKIGKVFSVPFPEIKSPEDLNEPAIEIMEKIREL